mgnify:CR=1 FL=1|jgi:hypothetical protein
MVLNDILEKEELRQEILNNNKSLDIMNKYKTITTINNMEYETLDRVAKYFEVDYECIKKLVQNNKRELIKNGLLILKGKETREFLGGDNISLHNYKGYFISDNRKFNNRSNTLVNKRCFLNMAMLLRDSKVAQEIRSKMLDIILNGNSNNETLTVNNAELLDKIEEQNKTINELLKMIESLSDKIDDLNKSSKTLTTKNNDMTVINITNLDKFKTYLNSLDDNVTMSKKEYIDLFNKYKFYHKKIGITLFNKFMVKQKQFKTSERLTDKNKKKNLFTYENNINNNSKGIYITKKGLLYVTDLIVNNMSYYF